MPTTVDLQMEGMRTQMLLNSAYEPLGKVNIQLTERFETQYRNLAGQVTKIESHGLLSYQRLQFYLPLSVLSLTPQLRNLFFFNELSNSILEPELCNYLAQEIADMVQVNYPGGSFFIKADVQVVTVELVDDEEEEEEEISDDDAVMELLIMMDSLDFVRELGASRSVIEKLKKERRVDNGGEVGTCMVCLEELSGVAELIKMPCSHLFHELCICRWLEEKNSCPICRCEVNEELVD